MKSIDEKTIIYLAGFFDGEGCICITHYIRPVTGTSIFQLKATVSNLNFDVLKLIKDNFGGGLTKKGKDGCYRYYSSSKTAANFIARILPYLIIKKEQAELALEFQKVLRIKYQKGQKNIALSENELGIRKRFKIDIAALNGSKRYLN